MIETIELINERFEASFERVNAGIDRVNTSIERTNATIDRTNANIDRAFAEMSKRMAESKAETDAEIAKFKTETEAEITKFKTKTDAEIAKFKTESDAKIAESKAKTDARLAETRDETRYESEKTLQESKKLVAEMVETVRRMSKRVDAVCIELGSMGHRIGALVEFIVIPGIRPQMNALGHNFRYIAANKAVKVAGQRKAEIDLFLHNGAEAMAVEIKSSLSVEDVNTHINRLRTLRKHESEANIQGKILYGAVIGMIIDEKARKFALKNGLYVAEIYEAENTMTVEEPKQRRMW